ncbi:TetR/AcrR family transcriptional regulator [Herbiconiux sp.]|uniref:TetR/AcrR family transcriptional regulator n=1 Tax=Herbiconiux sp. TaxID=1871186 RepID=UPI0025C57382|nr:TetR/AcrR family transcriptional regulator [Herbiconiux sp.]
MPETLTPPRAPRKDALENREAIVAAAATVFRHEPEASLDAVAAEAGLSRRSIYGHFASRDELLAELLTRGGSRISTALAGVHHDDPRIHLALVGAALWAEVQQVRVLAQLAVHGPLERTVAEALEPVRASVRDAVARGVTAGWFRDDVAPETLARLIEEAAIAVLDEAVRADLTEPEGARLVMTIGLSVAGLSWQSAAAVADALPATAITPAASSAPAPRAAVSSPLAPAAPSRPLAT